MTPRVQCTRVNFKFTEAAGSVIAVDVRFMMGEAATGGMPRSFQSTAVPGCSPPVGGRAEGGRCRSMGEGDLCPLPSHPFPRTEAVGSVIAVDVRSQSRSRGSYVSRGRPRTEQDRAAGCHRARVFSGGERPRRHCSQRPWRPRGTVYVRWSSLRSAGTNDSIDGPQHVRAARYRKSRSSSPMGSASGFRC
jgi:hypothetical protein